MAWRKQEKLGLQIAVCGAAASPFSLGVAFINLINLAFPPVLEQEKVGPLKEKLGLQSLKARTWYIQGTARTWYIQGTCATPGSA
ncbi:hypothetical protein T484DRAFT_1770132 [Baffinella frigidus]|nr:hypothetical protein T484DRAFT_1770132 [Cryptophyta sp. CCMP2293]